MSLPQATLSADRPKAPFRTLSRRSGTLEPGKQGRLSIDEYIHGKSEVQRGLGVAPWIRERATAQMAFRAGNSAGGLPASMAFNSIPGSRQGGAGGAAGAGGGGMPGFPSLSQGRPMSGQPGAGSFMGVGRGAGGTMGSFGINGLGGFGATSHPPPASSQQQQSEASLDPSDFPALGATGNAVGGGGPGGGAGPGGNAPSYASHVNMPTSQPNGASGIFGQLPGPGAPGGDRTAAALLGGRTDFTADDFPALDGTGPATADPAREAREQASASVALNAQMARLSAKQGAAAEGDKRFAPAQNAFGLPPAHLMNGISSNPQQQQQQSLLQAQAHAAHSAAVFRSPAPSNPPRPNSAAYSLGTNPDHLSSQTQGSADPPSTLPTSSIDGANPGAAGPRSAGAMVPQTPAQQVLYSPADRFGLLGLLQIIKHADPDTSKLTLGMDLTQLGLDLGSNNTLYSNFMTPWADPHQVAAANVEPEYHLPSCYNVSPTPVQHKIASFHDESLLWIFYNQPRDVLQELAAAELYKKNWRYHKELQTWLTKQAGVEPLEKNPNYERGEYIFFDTKEWRKITREYTLVYAQLESKPAFVQSPALAGQAIATLPQGHGPSVAAVQQAPNRTASAQSGGQQRVPSGVAA